MSYSRINLSKELDEIDTMMRQFEFDRKQQFELFERKQVYEMDKLKAFKKRVNEIHDMHEFVRREFRQPLRSSISAVSNSVNAASSSTNIAVAVHAANRDVIALAAENNKDLVNTTTSNFQSTYDPFLNLASFQAYQYRKRLERSLMADSRRSKQLNQLRDALKKLNTKSLLSNNFEQDKCNKHLINTSINNNNVSSSNNHVNNKKNKFGSNAGLARPFAVLDSSNDHDGDDQDNDETNKNNNGSGIMKKHNFVEDNLVYLSKGISSKY